MSCCINWWQSIKYGFASAAIKSAPQRRRLFSMTLITAHPNLEKCIAAAGRAAEIVGWPGINIFRLHEKGGLQFCAECNGYCLGPAADGTLTGLDGAWVADGAAGCAGC